MQDAGSSKGEQGGLHGSSQCFEPQPPASSIIVKVAAAEAPTAHPPYQALPFSLSPSVTGSSHTGLLAVPDTPGTDLPQGLCTYCALCLNVLPPDVSTALSATPHVQPRTLTTLTLYPRPLFMPFVREFKFTA